MNSIRRVIRQAKIRLVCAGLGRSLCYTFTAASIISLIAILALYFGDWEFNLSLWRDVFLAIVFVLALNASLFLTWLKAPSDSSVAQELDRRYQLQERISTALHMASNVSCNSVAAAQIADAERSVSGLAVTEKFELRPNRLLYLPCCFLPILFASYSLIDLENKGIAGALSSQEIIEPQRVTDTVRLLRKTIQERKKDAAAKNLVEAQDLFSRLEQKLERLATNPSADQKQTMIAMNDLRKQLEERASQLGRSEAVKRSLSPINGTTDKANQDILKAITEGDFQRANELMSDYGSKLEKGDLSDKDKQTLQSQLDSIRNALNEEVKRHEDRQDELENKLNAARQSGDRAEISQLERELESLRQQNPQIQSLSELANSVSKASQALSDERLDAGKSITDLAESLQSLQNESSELRDLEAALDDITISKNAMRCQSCAGEGCSECGGKSGLGDQPSNAIAKTSGSSTAGEGNQFGNGSGSGLGKGSGSGDRPESATETNTYQSRVQGDLTRGRAVISGIADGPNRKGISRETLQKSIEVSLQEKDSPTENQVLPRSEREHAMQYFNQLREGK
ncbi:hypothetical protein N9D38_08180 [Rubripirellula sp.]|nr:hypothetical protein [Rubripirellula sp.]